MQQKCEIQQYNTNHDSIQLSTEFTSLSWVFSVHANIIKMIITTSATRGQVNQSHIPKENKQHGYISSCLLVIFSCRCCTTCLSLISVRWVGGGLSWDVEEASAFGSLLSRRNARRKLLFLSANFLGWVTRHAPRTSLAACNIIQKYLCTELFRALIQCCN